ncbi:signal transduction histidine kinase [Candidatus Scalindua japonica]|uniref:Signal transduction histidine kinase n=1 Tax=Candidatus Scalindua japonica TaxID=1284222 RepID=A0A286U4G4_9BACT|nr:hypothetical protein [Candidatus Scalindua japonica]GAX63023.1 signal transduction histidine kinase [Candidatus Scalindua japonica]
MIITLCALNILFCQRYSAGYGYKKSEDPIITVFKSVIFNGRKGDWERVALDIDTISDRIDDVKNIFDVNLRPALNAGLCQHNFQEVIKVMANLVFLAMKEKFYWNISEGLRIFMKAKVRLRLADEYYTLLLSGNVRRYDRLNGTKFHDDIFNKFAEAGNALGSIGFLGAGAVSPKLNDFEIATKEIEQKLLIVFPYFQSGEEITY